MRGCTLAETAFLWSELPTMLTLDQRQWEMLDYGRREGLNEGMLVMPLATSQVYDLNVKSTA